MNHMKGKAYNPQLRRLAHSVGDFIRYWGFRRVHGAIWVQLYLSRSPMSCAELTRALGFSKALISPALNELVKYKLILEVPGPNDKVKLYSPAPKVHVVIQDVLKNREAKLLAKISDDYSALRAATQGDHELESDHIKAMGQMIEAANLMLRLVISSDDLFALPDELDP